MDWSGLTAFLVEIACGGVVVGAYGRGDASGGVAAQHEVAYQPPLLAVIGGIVRIGSQGAGTGHFVVSILEGHPCIETWFPVQVEPDGLLPYGGLVGMVFVHGDDFQGVSLGRVDGRFHGRLAFLPFVGIAVVGQFGRGFVQQVADEVHAFIQWRAGPGSGWSACNSSF